MKTVTEKVGRYLPFPKIPRKAPTKMAGAFSNARWSALRPMGPAYGRDPRDAPSLSLRLPGNAPQGRVSSASAHTGPARRTAALDGFQKSPSLRRGRRAGPLAPGHRAPSCDAPHGSRLLGVGSIGAHLPGLALLWQLARSVQARYGFCCTESSCRLRRGRAAPKSLSPKRPGRLLRPGPNAQSPRPFWFSNALRSSSQNALIAVAIPRSVKRTMIPLDRSTANPSLPPLTFLVAPSDFEW